MKLIALDRAHPEAWPGRIPEQYQSNNLCKWCANYYNQEKYRQLKTSLLFQGRPSSVCNKKVVRERNQINFLPCFTKHLNIALHQEKRRGVSGTQ